MPRPVIIESKKQLKIKSLTLPILRQSLGLRNNPPEVVGGLVRGQNPVVRPRLDNHKLRARTNILQDLVTGTSVFPTRQITHLAQQPEDTLPILRLHRDDYIYPYHIIFSSFGAQNYGYFRNFVLK